MTDRTPDALASALPAGWHVTDDAEGEPTLWFGGTAVLRKLDLFRIVGGKSDRAKQAFAFHLWDVLTEVHTPDEATVERLARAIAPTSCLGSENGLCAACEHQAQDDVRAVLAALVAAAPAERDGEVGE